MRTRVLALTFAAAAAVLGLGMNAHADPVWGSDASGDLTGSRTSAVGGGVTATEQWADGGFSISWNITLNGNEWTYVYTVTTSSKDISHLLLEVTQDSDNPFTWDVGASSPLSNDSPKTWSEGSGNPEMPNDLYGVKFDFGGNPVTYTIVTEHSPVWGVFYAKDGMSGGPGGGNDVVAWANALNFGDYQTNESLTINDFIVRPNSVIPEPASLALLGAAAACLVLRRNRHA